jgi:hypothetical protein
MIYSLVCNTGVTRDIKSDDAHTVSLEPLVSFCAAGECPTIFRTDRGTLVLQGYVFEPQAAGTTVPAGEQMIEIPAELLAEYHRLTT